MSPRKPIQLEPPFNLPIFALALRPAFAKTTPRSLSLPSALSPGACKELRQLAWPLYSRFELADAGRYRFIALRGEGPVHHREEPSVKSLEEELETLLERCVPLLSELRAFAGSVSGCAVSEGWAQIVALSRGDYSLRLDDARSRARTGFRALEATLDLSAHPGDAAATIYSEGRFTHLPIGQLPGQLSLVERGPASSRCDRYRSVLSGSREFVLLRASFPLAA